MCAGSTPNMDVIKKRFYDYEGDEKKGLKLSETETEGWPTHNNAYYTVETA